MPALILTVCYVIKDNQILLGYNKTSPLTKGLWNGYGGKVKKREAIETAAIRELKEESGLTALEIKKYGITFVTFENGRMPVELHVFVCQNYTGKPKKTDEMDPQWFAFNRDAINNLPFNQMWPTDEHFFAYFLVDKKFIAHFHLNNADERKVIDFKVTITEVLPEKVDWNEYGL